MPVTTRRKRSVIAESVAYSTDTNLSSTPARNRKRLQQHHAISTVLSAAVEQSEGPEPATPTKLTVDFSRQTITPSPVSSFNLEATVKKTKNNQGPISTEKIVEPPAGWHEIYTLVQELRADRTAPCDHSGCEALPDRTQSPRDFRFQVLISLMLSSQTKDATVGDAIRRMQHDQVLSVEKIHGMSAEKLNSYINKVGFHNNKTKYIKETVEILINNYHGEIPETAAEMMALPGVGPKMAYICESVAWNKSSGIGVDTHMHRLFNLLGWVKNCKNPEQTRLQLQSWLPVEYWGEVNLLWVGFGQEVQQYPAKILRKSLQCSRPVDALKLLKRCGLDYRKEGKKHGLEEEIAAALGADKPNEQM